MARNQLRHTKNVDDLLVKAGTLVQLSGRAHEKFGHVWEELVPSIATGQFTFQMYGDACIGFASWVKLSPIVASLYTNNLRPLNPSELNTGDNVFINFFVAPHGYPIELLKHIHDNVLNVSERKKFYAKTPQGIINVEPDFEFLRGVLF